MYKLEMHVHTSPTSRCASAKAEDAVAQYTTARAKRKRTHKNFQKNLAGIGRNSCAHVENNTPERQERRENGCRGSRKKQAGRIPPRPYFATKGAPL